MEEVVFHDISGICVQTEGIIICREDGTLDLNLGKAMRIEQRGSSLFFLKPRKVQTLSIERSSSPSSFSKGSMTSSGNTCRGSSCTIQQTCGGKTVIVKSKGSLKSVSITDGVVKVNGKIVDGDSYEEAPKTYRLGEGCSISAIIHRGNGTLCMAANFMAKTLDVMSTGDAEISLANAHFANLSIVQKGSGLVWRASADKLVATVEGNGTIIDMNIDKEARLKVKGTGSIEAEAETYAEVSCSGDIGRIIVT